MNAVKPLTTPTTNSAAVTIAQYHRTLSAARALRAAYVATLTANEAPAERIDEARRHAAFAWRAYLDLCRRHGLLAAHS